MSSFNWMIDSSRGSLADKLGILDQRSQPLATPVVRNDLAALLRHAGELLAGFSAGPHTHFGMIAAALDRAGDTLESLFTTPEAVAEFQARCGFNEDDIERLIFVRGGR